MVKRKSTDGGDKQKNGKREYSDGSTAYIGWVRVKGFKTVTRSFKDKKAMQAWAATHKAELQTQRKLGASRPDISTLTVKKLADEFLDDPETKRLAYFPDLQNHLAWWVNSYGAERMEGFGVFLIREARAKLVPGRKPATVNRYLSAMRRAWNWGKNAGLILDSRSWPKELLFTEAKARTRYLDDGELRAVLDAAKAHSSVMHAAILLSIATGLRQGELLRLTWKDVDLDKGQLRVMQSKNGDARVVYVPAPAVDALKSLKKADVVSARDVFLTQDGTVVDQNKLEHRWKAIRKTAGLTDFRWHDFRHTSASYLAQHGATLLEIGSVLGHRSPSVTMRYAHLLAGAPVTGHAQLGDKLLAKQSPT